MTRRKNKLATKTLMKNHDCDIYDKVKKEKKFNNKDVDKVEPASHNPKLKKKLPRSQPGLEITNNASFTTLKGRVSEETLQAVEEMGFSQMTEIQTKAIPPLLDCRDLVGNSKTGSGKTLAFLIPAVELIVKSKFKPRTGVGCIIVTPTRELAIQTFAVLQELMKYHPNTHGLVMEAADRETEAKKLQKGINILVATPQRLLDHLKNTPGFIYKNLKCLVIDEVDRILEIGLENKLKQIINLLPERRLTMLFSKTSNKKTKDLTRLAIKTAEPVFVGVDDSFDKATTETSELGYVVCPPDKKFLLLFTFLKKNRSKKIIVFFSSFLSVKFHDMLINHLDLPVTSIHGKQEQKIKAATFSNFCNAESGILLCTDVTARDFDIPAVDWIVQFDPPDDPKEFIRLVGNVTCGEEESGHSLIVLRPEEQYFIDYLKNNNVTLNKMDFSWNKVADIQLQIEKLIRTNYALNLAANDGFKSCVKSYDSHQFKNIFNIKDLNLTKLAKTFGLTVPPRVDLSIDSSDDARPRKRSGGDFEQNENQKRIKRPYKFIQVKQR